MQPCWWRALLDANNLQVQPWFPPLSLLIHCEQKVGGSPQGTSPSTFTGQLFNLFIFRHSSM